MRKFFLFAAALCCAVMINAQEIGTWSGFCKGAASFTFEGGAPSHSSDGASLFNKYGYTASFYLVVNWAPDWAAFKALADMGHEIGSNSVSYPQDMTGEEKSSKDSINAHITNHSCLTVAYSNCNIPNQTAVMQNYIAGRACDFSGSAIISIDGPSNWCDIKANMTGKACDVNSTNAFTNLMQKAIQQGGWVVFGSWGFVGKKNGNATYSPTDLNAIEGALQWAQHNDIWIAPLRDVAMYIKERKAASFTETSSTAASKTYSLTHSIADAVCAYQYPLSLRVPSNGWTDIEVSQAGKKLDSKIEGGDIYFDAIPNGGDIVVKISTEGIDQITNGQSPRTNKFFRDGQLFIQRGDNTYSITGQEVK